MLGPRTASVKPGGDSVAAASTRFHRDRRLDCVIRRRKLIDQALERKGLPLSPLLLELRVIFSTVEVRPHRGQRPAKVRFHRPYGKPNLARRSRHWSRCRDRR